VTEVPIEKLSAIIGEHEGKIGPVDTLDKPTTPDTGVGAALEDDGFALHGFPFIATMASFCLGCFVAGLDWTSQCPIAIDTSFSFAAPPF